MSLKETVSQMNIVVEPIQESEIEMFDEILRTHVRDSRTGQVIEDEVSAIKGYMRGEADGYGRVRKYLVAKDNSGRVLGCMAYSTPDPDMLAHFDLKNTDDSVELLNAFVSSEVFRGGGVGQKLLDAICATAKSEGKKELLIHSGPRYEKSWGFYDKMTDKSCGFIENKYGEGRHAKTWEKAL